VPIFVYVLGFDPRLAIAMSLPVVGGTSLVGAMSHWKAGNVNLKTAALFGVIAMCGAYVVFLTGAMQLAILAVVMLAAAASMLRSARREPAAGAAASPERPMAVALLVPIAITVGLITGLVGIGGGFLVVPALVLLARVPMKQAVGTSLLVIAMNSVAGFAGYAGRVAVPWTFMAEFTAVASVGILAGTHLVRFVSPRSLKQWFAVFLLCIGAFILYKNRNAFRPQVAVSVAMSATR
jgi:uncharacterized membrane protein YfcA